MFATRVNTRSSILGFSCYYVVFYSWARLPGSDFDFLSALQVKSYSHIPVVYNNDSNIAIWQAYYSVAAGLNLTSAIN